ncbi:O-antigen ligase [Bosea sp. 124]|uniref:O-antigen ligase family protein n=1 Tax=Bosea sp. 124 TaxID=2135642 RepID=UPI000D3C62FA|nr:O-antigen ligase [Bosea sp. 124]PTM41431.1 O-antigen ligase [Bosea sp. 124]
MSVGAGEATQADAVSGARAAIDRGRAIAAFLSGLGLFILLLTLQPFAGPPVLAEGESSGNVVNQIGYVSLALVYGAAMLAFSERAALARLRSSGLLVVFAVAAVSLPEALDPEAAFRALLLASFAMVLVVGILVLPWTEASFANAAANATLVLLLLVYAALLLAPHLAVHGAEGVEGGHAGDWRGHLSHKNYAAPVFSMVAMFGIYVWRMGLTLRGAAVVLLSVVFVLNSGSKTTMGFLPVAIGLVLLARGLGRPRLGLAMHVGMVLLIGALTVGTIFSPALLKLSAAINPDPTFTGRDEIWKFAAARIGEKPWFGYGYVSFWQTPAVTRMEENFEASWDIRGIGSGHNSYLDAMLMFGIPGALVIIYCLMVKPLQNYLAAQADPDRRRFADLCAMIVMFMTYVGMLESFFLNRAEPVWLLFAFAVLGLECARRMTMRRA